MTKANSSALHRIGQVISAVAALAGRLLLRFWDGLRSVAGILWPARFSALTLAAGGALLILTAQGRELAVSMVQPGEVMNPSLAIFLLAVTWYAIQTWYWARVSYLLKFGADHRRRDWRTAFLPRLYAALAFGFAALSLAMAGGLRAALWPIGLGALFILVLICRMAILRRMTGRGRPPDGAGGSEGALRIRDLGRGTLLALAVSVLFSAVTMAAVIVWPVAVGRALGPAAVAFLAFSQIVPVGTMLVIVTWKTRIPLIATLLVWAFLISDLADNHRVPVMEGRGVARIQRPDAAAAASAWLDATGATVPEGSARPVVFVATAGGGLRAAYWTAVVLGTLQERCPGFDQHLFSISGVSGGSVGAAMYETALANGLAAPSDVLCGAPGASDGEVLARTTAALHGDFLGPTIAAMLYPDLLQRLIPAGILPDRGAALVAAWNAGWADAAAAACKARGDCGAGGGDLSSAFLDVAGLPGQTPRWRPILALNGTHQETGKRIVASNVAVTTADFLDAFDLLDLIGGDVSMGVAALNSARFTYVSPAGLLVTANGARKMGHVLDGGYFENYGAVTGAELARVAIETFEAKGVPVRPVVIQISSDPGLDWKDAPAFTGAVKFLPFLGSDRSCWYWFGQRVLHGIGLRRQEVPQELSNCLANELAGPIRGVLATRTARGVLANKTVSDIVDELNDAPFRFPSTVAPVFAHFRICADPYGLTPPLGWAMSDPNYLFLGRLVQGRCGEHDNARELRRVLDALRNPLPVSCAPAAAEGVVACDVAPASGG